MAGVQRIGLNCLNTNLKNSLIIGIIIAKNSPRTIGSRKKNGDMRGVTSFTLRDSEIDTINVDVWGSEYFVLTFYERFLVGDVVEISYPKICVKTGENENFRPQVTSPFYLSLNEGTSDVSTYNGESFSTYLQLLHIPTKPAAGYCGLAEVLKFTEQTNNVYVDLLVVVKSVKPRRIIKTKAGAEMTIGTIEIIDNTTPASVSLDIFDIDTIQRAEEWRPLDSVLFIADARVSWRGKGVKVQICARSVITHQPYTADAEALRLYIRNQANTRGGWGGCVAWSASRGEARCAARVREELRACAAGCATLHALVTHLDLAEIQTTDNNEEVRIRFADHTGEISAWIPVNVLEETLGLTPDQLKVMSSDEKAVLRWKILLEQCSANIVVSPPRLTVLALRRASVADPIPLC
ncbi:meiosis-specific with OB domain-containing protein-like [Manduca sexta]|uniref:MEIOB-like N-terminal domain-containing protein n=1 Tax=Manduca sexta TaxID=7130 RepID=A0A921YP57_MANSE|nr:meiosis-specific with OB domain-containing protein-like [Manduca sexta]KAG6442232.1 hypothetical protein O3G_MSEX002206 [Manduca sexta]